jgi:hypothetical protein
MLSLYAKQKRAAWPFLHFNDQLSLALKQGVADDPQVT